MEHPPLKLAHKMVDKSQLGLIDFQVSVSRQTKAAAVARCGTFVSGRKYRPILFVTGWLNVIIWGTRFGKRSIGVIASLC